MNCVEANKKEMNGNRFINREIVRLSVPAIVTNITVPLLGLSDTAISGHLGSESFLGAVAVGSMMMNALFWLFGFLRMGTTGMTAQNFGRGDDYGIRLVFTQSLFLSLLIGFVMLLFSYRIESLLLHFIAPDAEVSVLASQYFHITIWGAPAVLANMAVLGWFLGMQNTSYPMMISIGVNIVNIIISVLAVFVFGCGFKGIAIGTLSANWLGLAVSLFVAWLYNGKKSLLIYSREIIRYVSYKKFFKINGDIFFRSACIMAVSLSMTSFGAGMGTLVLAANALIMQFFLIFSYFMDGIAFTGEALCGRFAGQNSLSMLRLSVRLLLIWSVVLTLIFGVVYFIWWKPISCFITKEADVIETVARYSLWLRLIPPVTVLAFVFDGIYIGLTATRRMLWVTVAASLAFFGIALCHVGNAGIYFAWPASNDCLWVAFLIYLGLRGGLLAIMSPHVLSARYVSSLHS